MLLLSGYLTVGSERACFSGETRSVLREGCGS
jgi:hypothetical protein